jgi:excisionase family DNA binding protein
MDYLKENSPISINNINNLWSINDVAIFLNVTHSAIRAWVQKGQIRYHKVGTLIRFFPDEIIDDARVGNIGKRSIDLSDNKIKVLEQQLLKNIYNK